MKGLIFAFEAKIFYRQGIGSAKDNPAFDSIFQLPDVARKFLVLQDLQGLR